ncbi:MAG: MBL fold metallo-hydrolase, partial [Lachnospiraceae bacterium]|nr:MBL fold metallo-hydrolase [Lachnospiraceae bacterium]
MNKKLLFLTALIAGLLLAVGLVGSTRAEASELHLALTHYLDAAGDIQEEMCNYDAWTESTSLPQPTKEGVYIYLTGDVTLGGQYLINNIEAEDPKREIYIDLNGHTIYGANNGRIICFNNTQGGVKVVITDSSEGKTGKLQGRGSHGMGGGGIYFRQGVLPNTLVLDGVTIQGATTTNWGAGIGATDAVDGSEQANLLLYKTNITNCTGKLGSALFLGTKFYTTRLYDVAISGCTSTESGAIYVKNGSAKMFGPNSSITNCNATKFGGAVYITGGSFTIEDVAISGCSAGNYGGAIYNTAGTFTMDGNSSIKKCYSKGDRGGAIHAENATTVINGGVIGGSTADKNYTQGSGFSAGLHIYAGTFRMTGGEISYQESVYGGANVALFQATDTNYAQATITGGTIKNGVLTGSNTSHSGGNICVYGHSTLTIGGETEENQPVISGGTNTVSGGYGGNIGLRNYASLTINGYATIADGSAIYGGAVFSPAGTTITMSNGTLSGNHSSNDGGAIHSKGTATITGGKIIKNYSTGGRGGAIYSASTIKLGNVTIGGSEADANYNGLEKQGGAILVENAAGDIEIDGATITYNHGGFGGNLVVQSTAKGTFKSGTIGYGKAEKYYAGNVAIFSSGTTFTMSGGEILGGEANTYGGSVVVRDTGITFTMTGGTIRGGVATTYGGNLAINGAAEVSISGNAKIIGGTANGTDGGGNIYCAEGSSLTVSGSAEISNGNALNGPGGNINMGGNGTLKISGGTISGGNASTHSGNIRGKSSVITITSGTITGGTAGTHGGNMTSSGTITFSGGTISNGIAYSTDFGAGNIYYDGSSFTMSGTATISGGYAPRAGGVYLGGTFNMNGGTITGCSARSDTGANGGAIYVGSGTFTMSGGVIENCYTSVLSSDSANYTESTNKFDGGAIYVGSASAIVNLNGGEVRNNYINNFEETGHTNVYKKQSRGGSIFCLGTLNINGGKVLNGKVSSYGGNIVLSGSSASLNLLSGEISGGVSLSSQCGNIAAIGGSRVMISGGSVKNGQGTSAGNIGILDANTSLSITGGTIIGGSASNGPGGNIYVRDAGSLSINGSNALIADGVANTYGGNIALGNSASCEIKSGMIVGGRTTNGFGGNIALGGSKDTNGSATCTLTISGGTIANGHSSSWGGNIAVRTGIPYGDGTELIPALTISGDAVIVGGVAGSNGGNIAVANTNLLVKMAGGKILGGTARDNGGNITLNDPNDKFIVTGGVVSGGSGSVGGNIAMFGTAQTLSVTDAGIGSEVVMSVPKWDDTNKKTVFVNDALDLESKTFGGGVSTSAGSNGGGNIYAASSATSVAISNTAITGGRAANNGGNIYCVCRITMTGGSISGGYADHIGGNIYTTADLTLNGSASISGGTVGEMEYNYDEEHNPTSVKYGFGGSVYFSGAHTLTMNDTSSISGGEASAYGGNLVLTNGSLIMNGSSSIKNGTAGTNGGNITVTGDGSIAIHHSAEISGGPAADSHGGNIALNSNGSLSMDGGKILGGTAKVFGSNLHINGTGNLTISAGTIIGGTLTEAQSGREFSDIHISGNVDAAVSGGYYESIYASSKRQFITGGYFINAPKNGYLGSNYLNKKGTYAFDSVDYQYQVVSIDTAAADYKYPSGLAFFDAGEGNFVQICTGVSESDYASYIGALGLTKLYDNGTGIDNGNVLFEAYKDADDTFRLNVSYMKQTGVMYIEYSTDLKASPYLNAPAPAGTNVFDKTVLVMPSLQYATQREDATSGYAAGNSFIIRLKNGHFIVNDGGSPAETNEFLQILMKMSKDEKPVIEAWFLTHAHGDHYGVLKSILDDEDLRDDIIVNGVYMSLPAYGYETYNSIQSLVEKVPLLSAESGNAVFYRPYTGQKYYFDDVVVEIALSQDQLPVTEVANYSGGSSLFRYGDLNDTSLFTMIRIGDQKVLIGGDGDFGCARFMQVTYTDDYRDVDVLSLLHHGYNIQMHFKSTVFSGASTDYSSTDLLFTADTVLYTGLDNPNGAITDSTSYEVLKDERLGNIYQSAARSALATWLPRFESAGTFEHFSYSQGTRVLVFPYAAGDSFVFEEHNASDKCWNEGEVTTAAACETAGVRTFTCFICGGTREEVIPAIGHAYVFDGFVWTEYSAVAHYTCDHDHEHTTTVVPVITSEVTVEPTF